MSMPSSRYLPTPPPLQSHVSQTRDMIWSPRRGSHVVVARLSLTPHLIPLPRALLLRRSLASVRGT
eukprot:301386-Rhodomonas_salina.1